VVQKGGYPVEVDINLPGALVLKGVANNERELSGATAKLLQASKDGKIGALSAENELKVFTDTWGGGGGGFGGGGASGSY
jgi:hypothetical protein